MAALHDTDREPGRQDDETCQPHPEHRGSNHQSHRNADQGRVSIGRRDRGAISCGTRFRVPALASQNVSTTAAGVPMRTELCFLSCIVPTSRKLCHHLTATIIHHQAGQNLAPRLREGNNKDCPERLDSSWGVASPGAISTSGVGLCSLRCYSSFASKLPEAAGVFTNSLELGQRAPPRR